MSTRRQFLASTAGLVVGVMLPAAGRAQSGAAAALGSDMAMEGAFAPNAFVRVAPDDTVTVMVKHIEFGQGPNTGLSTLVAEEMDAAWDQMRAESAPADPAYANLFFGMQGTGGSTGMANSYAQMRKAGAAARSMLVEAASVDWGVPAGEITVSAGRIRHEASGRDGGFGQFAEAASVLPVPQDPVLKDPADFVLIGTRVPKLDSAAKSRGEAIYTMDVYRDGMLTVVTARPPAFGARLASFDEAPALAVDGVEMVRETPFGVSVYARSTAAALKGREALTAEWDFAEAETRSSAQMMDEFAAAADGETRIAEEAGDAAAAIEGADRVIEAEFRFPYLAHAPMEPLDAVLEIRGGKAELWMGSQFPALDHPTLAQVLGIPPGDASVNVMFAGGSFGRRAQPTAHVAAEIAAIAKAAGDGALIDGAWKLIFTREDDIRGGYYRPLTVHKMRAGLTAEGEIAGWRDVVVNQSIMAGGPMEAMMQDGMDPTSYEGAVKMPYELPDLSVEWVRRDSPVPVLWWRSVGHTHAGYATEVFLDMLLEAAGKDPVQGRLDLIRDDAGRDRAVLERVAAMAGWDGQRVRDGRGYGVALHESFSTYAAQIAEVEDRGGAPHVTRVWCAVDCGVAVNPDVVRAQIEGGIGFGLGSVLHEEVTIEEGGRVAQANFDDYPVLRITEMPAIEVEIVESALDPSGIGEPGTPPIGPALANAWRALTGESVTTLPFSRRTRA